MTGKEFHLHLVSDATGETVASVARACVIQFDAVKAHEHVWNLIRTPRHMEMVLGGIRRSPGPVMYTIIDESLRQTLQTACREIQVPCLAVLEPVMTTLAGYLGLEYQRQPGRQHILDAEYFGRMDAVEFALAHDDGQAHWNLHEADVVLVGVSRTSKTPTCFYLANRGIKAGNVPYVPGCPLPAELDRLETVLIVGLTNDPRQLVHIRRTRFRFWNQREETDYVDHEGVRKEVIESRRYFARKGWPVIDVSQRSIEETAAEVMMLLARWRGENGFEFEKVVE